MLLSLIPGASVNGALRRLVDSETVALVELGESFVAPPVGVVLYAKPVRFLILPVTSELTTVCPPVRPESLKNAVDVVASIGLAVSPLVDAIAIAFVVYEVSDEGRLVRPLFHAHALHHILAELSFKHEEVYVSTNSLSVVHVVGPLSLVGLPLDVSEFAVTMSVSQIPRPFVRGAVPEHHLSLAVSEASEPLTTVDSARSAILVLLCHKLLIDFSLLCIVEEA